MMTYLLLKDLENKVCQLMHVTNDIDDLISSNVAAMILAKIEVNVHTVDLTISTKKYTDAGWVFDDGLYEKLLFRYSNQTGKFLTRWR